MSRMNMARFRTRREIYSRASEYKNRFDEIELTVNGFKIATDYFYNSRAIEAAKRKLRIIAHKVDSMFVSDHLTCTGQGVLIQFDFKIYHNHSRYHPVLKGVHIVGVGKNSKTVFQRRRRYIGSSSENYITKSRYLWVLQTDIISGVWKNIAL